MNKDIILRADGTHERVLPKNGKNYTAEELNTIVGGYIEIVPCWGMLLVCNEEGKLQGLPLNVNATTLYGCDQIVGDVLLCYADRIK